MSRARTAAALLAAVAVIVPVSDALGAGPTTHFPGVPSLSPTPPVPLPSAPVAVHHRHQKPNVQAKTPLPHTGMNVAEELLLASVLAGGGAGVRVASRRRRFGS